MLLFHRGLWPSFLFNLFRSTVTHYMLVGPLSMMSFEALSKMTAAYLGQIGSIILLLIAHNFYHYIKLDRLLGPCSNINYINV